MPAPISLYVHWPFCRSLCPYCDFNSHVREGVDHARWREALLAELEHFAAPRAGRPLASIFFGGGTPSLMEPATAGALIARAKELFAAAPDLEVTLEANPTSVEAGRLKAFAAAGVNRASLGVQALDDAALAALGRTHGAEEARAAIAAAQAVFPRTSFDLIYARPGQTVAAWTRELEAAAALARGHLSVYQLTIERGTPFFLAEARGDLTVPDPDTGAALYEATQAILERAGLPAYEISNHAAPGEECRHNLAYWRSDDYIGIGPGAHGRLAEGGQAGVPAVRATRQHAAPEIWLARVEADGHAGRTDAPIGRAVLVEEVTMMGLRLAEGISAARFRSRTGIGPAEAFDPAVVARLVEGGFLDWRDDGFAATPAGRQRLNAVVAALLARPIEG